MKYYPPSKHIYYENSDVAINKLNIKDLKIITEIEKELVIKSYETLDKDVVSEISYYFTLLVQ